MTTIVVDPLQGTPLTLEVEYTKDRRFYLEAIRPYIYIHNLPSGTFTYSIKTESDVVIKSQTFTAADIQTALGTADPYFHAYYKIDFGGLIIQKGAYKLELDSSGYTFAESAYIALVQPHENIFNDITYNPASHHELSYGYQLWGYSL